MTEITKVFSLTWHISSKVTSYFKGEGNPNIICSFSGYTLLIQSTGANSLQRGSLISYDPFKSKVPLIFIFKIML